jgi:hypothetical protein
LYLWEAEDLFDYWRQSPPIHELMAAYVGYKPPATAAKQSGQDFASFYAEMMG